MLLDTEWVFTLSAQPGVRIQADFCAPRGWPLLSGSCWGIALQLRPQIEAVPSGPRAPL